jgi:hypothetical protein
MMCAYRRSVVRAYEDGPGFFPQAVLTSGLRGGLSYTFPRKREGREETATWSVGLAVLFSMTTDARSTLPPPSDKDLETFEARLSVEGEPAVTLAYVVFMTKKHVPWIHEAASKKVKQ